MVALHFNRIFSPFLDNGGNPSKVSGNENLDHTEKMAIIVVCGVVALVVCVAVVKKVFFKVPNQTPEKPVVG